MISFRSHDQISADMLRAMEDHFTRGLDRLEKELGSRKKSRYLYFHAEGAFPGMQPLLVRRAEALTRQVWATGGTGSTRTELELIKAVAAAADAGSLPFFRECLARNVPRERTGPERRALALLGIALAARGGSTGANEELRKQLGAAKAELRAAAVRATSASFGEQLPRDLRLAVEGIAQSDTAFAPRFLARGALVALGAKPILDAPKGSYTFTAALRETRVISRTVELRSEQSLHDLAGAVLDAFGWERDHLYCFYFDERDTQGPFTIGLDDEYGNPFDGLLADEDEDAAEDEDEAEAEAPDVEDGTYGMDLPVGALGLVERQRFVFHFDFGDDHLFDISVDAISEQSPRVKLPRVVAKTGRSPAQYRRW
jgi:hypothetical protein